MQTKYFRRCQELTTKCNRSTLCPNP